MSDAARESAANAVDDGTPCPRNLQGKIMLEVSENKANAFDEQMPSAGHRSHFMSGTGREAPAWLAAFGCPWKGTSIDNDSFRFAMASRLLCNPGDFAGVRGGDGD